MTTTADKASGNGATTTTKQVPAQREHGLNRLREDQTYHLSALIVACLSEAEHLVRKVNSKAFSRTIDHDGTKGTTPLDPAEIAGDPHRSTRVHRGRDCVPVRGIYRPAGPGRGLTVLTL